MQVNNINVTNAIPVVNSVAKKQGNTSFKGLMSTIGNTNKNFIHFLEKGGFFAEFCLMDMCGLVLPRVYQGFHRNKEELGHLNYQAGMEEFLRESITGPSMFLIPIGAVILAGRLMGKATQINTKLLCKFSELFEGVGTNVAKNSLQDTNKLFAGRLFDELFTNASDKVANAHQNLAKFKDKFVEQLTDSVGTKLKKSALKAKEDKFVELVSDINVSFFKKENTYGTRLASASDIFDSARKYMEDVIHSTKLSVAELPNKGLNSTKFEIDSIIKKLTQIRKNGRELLCIGGTAALAAFLSIIPKIYQLSNKNPALIGLEDNKKDGKSC